MNTFVAFQGKVQKEELDSCRAEPVSGGRQRDEAAGRNQSGSRQTLRDSGNRNIDNFGASRKLYWLIGYRSDAITSYHNRLVAK
jgi:hypothetical protein